jgi:hypothetical protein
MGYGKKLKEVLDKCNLSPEEREKFEDFMDGKFLKNKEAYPDFEVTLRQAVENDAVLDAAQKKIHLCKQWSNILVLVKNYKL